MSEITQMTGNKIRFYRKKNNLTIEELAAKIHKSKATVSKYERGDISIDIDTLYELADVLKVTPEQLLYRRKTVIQAPERNVPSFFQDVSAFYGYFYDGRDKQVIRSYFELQTDVEQNRQGIRMYMNFQDYDHYQDCENTYEGFIEHYDAVTNILLTNVHLPMEKASIQLLASSLYANKRWGLWNGLSSRPLMPVSTKILLSVHRIKDSDDILSQLKISNEDIKLFRLYNMFPVF